MKMPTNTKPWLQGAVGGFIGGVVVLLWPMHFKSPGDLEQARLTGITTGKIAMLAPICAKNFMAQPDFAAKKAAFAAETSDYKRREMFPEDWVKIPGDYSRNAAVAEACWALIEKDKKA